MDEQGTLWERPAPRADGPIATAVKAEIDQKITDGIMSREQYAGQIAQVLTLAAEVDATVGVGRPSGRAQIHDVLHRLLFDLPQPERTGTATDLDRALELIMEQGGTG